MVRTVFKVWAPSRERGPFQGGLGSKFYVCLCAARPWPLARDTMTTGASSVEERGPAEPEGCRASRRQHKGGS